MQTRKALAGILFVAVVCTAGAQEARISPHENSDVTVAGKHVTISYGRPSIRGREIMGGLVPYDRVWRTGADEATTLTTPIDLNIGGIDAPAGKYTLWTLPSSGTWKLIINKETGQWGTKYDAAQDLGRVDMHKTTLPEPVNEFTISWKTKGERSAELVLEWENTRVSVPVLAK